MCRSGSQYTRSGRPPRHKALVTFQRKVTFFLYLVTTEIASFTAHTLPTALHAPKRKRNISASAYSSSCLRVAVKSKAICSLTRVHNLGGTFLSSTFQSQQKLHIRDT